MQRTTLKLLHDFEINICQINAVEEMELTKQEAINLFSELIDLIKDEI